MFISQRSPYYLRKAVPLISPAELSPILKLDFSRNLQTQFCKAILDSSLKNENFLIESINHNLRLCIGYFEQGLKTQNFTEEKLLPYYIIARKMIRLAKISLLKHKLLEEKVDIHLFSNNLDTINLLLSRVYVAYEKIDFALPSKYINKQQKVLGQPYAQNFLSSYSLENENEKNFPLAKYDLEKTRAERVFQDLWKQRQALIKFHTLTHSICKDSWEEQLKEALQSIVNPLDFCEVASALDASQILKIISLCNEEENLQPICPYALVSADYNTFQEILHCLSYDEEALYLTKTVLKKAINSDKEIKNWVEKNFYSIRQTFVDTRNHLSKTIDDLCKKYRGDLSTQLITKKELQEIDDLHFSIVERKNNVKILLYLFQGLLENKLTLNLLNQLIITYEQDTTRLVEKASPSICGNVWEIIRENSFEVNNCESEDDAIECFALWHLTTAESLLNCSLITLEEFHKEIDDHNRHHGNSLEKNNLFNPKEETLKNFSFLAIERLEKLGIHTIGDFERLRIYNVNLLKDFLESSSNS